MKLFNLSTSISLEFKKLSKAKVEKIKTLREQGLSYREIAKAVGVSYATVRKYLSLPVPKVRRWHRLSPLEIEKIRKLRRQGYSYYEIARKMKIDPSTVGRRAKDVRMSEVGRRRYEERLHKLRVEIGKLGGKLAVEKGILDRARMKSIKVRTKYLSPLACKMSLDKALVIISLICDGSMNVKKRTVVYKSKNYVLAKLFSENMAKAYEFKYKEPKLEGNIFRVEYSSRELIKDLLRYTPSYSTKNEYCKIPGEIMRASREWKRQVLRRAFDEEGFVGYYPERRARYITFSSESKTVRNQIISLLKEFEIEAREYEYEYGSVVYVGKRENLRRFAEEINFTPSVEVVKGKCWLGWEKREVLKTLLGSYE